MKADIKSALENIDQGITENAQIVLDRRYLAKDENNKIIEDVRGMWERVAWNLSEADLIYLASKREDTFAEFYKVMANLEFLPNSPTLMNAGRRLQQLSGCFVLPVEDSIEDIFTQVKNTATIHKSGGGTGFSFSRLRPEGDVVGSTGGIASGPVSFIRAFDAATDVVKQGGTRRGANMGILNVDHPDILKFIHAKEDGTQLQNFNISVAVNAAFMDKVRTNSPYNLINPKTKEVVGQLNAGEVFDQIAELAWKTGDPGLVFIDRINDGNPNPHLGTIESTNPCGEQPLLPFESCNLGSINLAKMVTVDGDVFHVDWNKLYNVTKTAVHFLDNVVDMNNYPLPEIKEMSQQTRRIGLGVMGWADMLIMLGISYDSTEAIELAEMVMYQIHKAAFEASKALAEKRGSFPAHEGSIYEHPMRNSAPITIAPTGTISIIAGASSGIEPLFAIAYERNVMDETRLIEVNPYFEAIAHHMGFHSTGLMKEIAEKGTLEGIEEVPDEIKRLFKTSHDIEPIWHVRMQAAFQRWTDNAVSKTINLDANSTVQDVIDCYFLAWDLGCKGITVYRDGSKANQVLNVGTDISRVESPRETRERPRKTYGITERVKTAHGTMYITLNFDENKPFEVFGTLGKAGTCDSAQLEAISRLVSLALRSGVDPAKVLEQLKGITCCPTWDEGVLVRSGPDAVALALERNINTEIKQDLTAKCRECRINLVFQEGCMLCPSCGDSKCG